ncbi:general transcription factor IIE subunit 1 [Lethenteron reissneri]|uniref:general transcription factor IIE subunit 1 n=1 Tax=Lethenteron reissneri TaxID=7753 RepID=UPI002AB74058|nr:general transcription factor IIE subunit 1 [Lethenteron reissneri]
MTEPEVLTEVPASLKRLAKFIVRGFYGSEYALALDVLIRNPCVREEDIQELLKFDRKQLRSVLNTLKADKFIKCRMCMETAPDGKSTRHNYYFINYRLLVNVVKYKLDHMRRKLETDERDSTNRASFRCPDCSKTFTDLEANQLYDIASGLFMCTFCRREVEEDESAVPKKDARTLVARFNEQIEPIYALLRETEDINLSHEVLEPEPSDIPALKHLLRGQAVGAGLVPAREAWSARAPTYDDLYTQNVTISLEQGDPERRGGSSSATAAAASEDRRPAKERPVWMTESTVQGAYHDSAAAVYAGVGSETGPDGSDQRGGGAGGHKLDSEEVMRALLVHEKKSSLATGATAAASSSSLADTRAAAAAIATVGGGGGGGGGGVGGGAGGASDSESDTSESGDDSPPAKRRPQASSAHAALQHRHQQKQHHQHQRHLPQHSQQQQQRRRDGQVDYEDDDDDDDDEFEEVTTVTVMVAGRPYPYSEVSQNPQLVAQMTAEEKEAYIRTGQEMFQDMYD